MLLQLTAPDVDRRDTEAIYNKYTIGELYTNVTQVSVTLSDVTSYIASAGVFKSSITLITN